MSDYDEYRKDQERLHEVLDNRSKDQTAAEAEQRRRDEAFIDSLVKAAVALGLLRSEAEARSEIVRLNASGELEPARSWYFGKTSEIGRAVDALEEILKRSRR